MNSTSADISKPELTDREFSLFRDLILTKTGISLRDTKCPMLSARLQRRLRHLNLSSFGAYYQLLVNQDPAGEERRELINCITTNKTSFFREPHHFNFLAEVFKHSLGSSASTPFKVWSAACSTGEEPFTMAMTLRDLLDNARVTREHSVLATDIDTQVLQFGRASIYLESDLHVVPQPFRQRFFLKGSGSQAGRYRVKPRNSRYGRFPATKPDHPAWDVNAPFDIIFAAMP